MAANASVVLELIAQTEKWDGGIKRAQSGLTNFIRANGGLSNAMSKHGQTMLDAVRKFGSIESKAATVSGRLREMESMFMEMSDQYRQMSAAERANPIGREYVVQLRQLRTQILETKSAMQSAQGQLSLGGNGRSFGQQFMQSLAPGIGMGAGAFAAIKAAQMLQEGARLAKDTVKDVINTNMEFEQSNANLAAILGKTNGEIEQLTANARTLGGQTKFTASEITELQTVLARRGLREDQIVEMTHGIANLAIATGTDLAQSAELAASTMQAFGLKATDMERIVSVLGVSTTKSALTTEALGTSLQYVAPAARAAGFSLEDTVAMLGTLVDNGLNASTAGTSIRQIMLSMSTSSGKLAKALGGPVKSFDELVAALKRIKRDGADSLDSISKAVRVTALPAFLALVNNAERLDELRGSITDVGDELQKMADTQMDTAKGSAIILKSAWEGLKLTFEESNGAMKSFLDTLTQVVNKIKEKRALDMGGQMAVDALSGGKDDAYYEKKAEDWLAERRYNNLKAASGATSEAVGFTWDGTVVDNTPDMTYKHYGKLNGLAMGNMMETIFTATDKNPFEEANDELKDSLKLYNQLISLSREFSKHTEQYKVVGGQVAGAGAVTKTERVEDSVWRRITDTIEELTGVRMGFTELNQYNENLQDKIKTLKKVMSKKSAELGSVLNVDADEPEDTGKNILGELQKLNKGKTPEEKAKERVDGALLDYQSSIEKATIQMDAGSIDQEQYSKKLYNAAASLSDAYLDAAALTGDPEYKSGYENLLVEMQQLAEQTKELADIREKEAEAEKEQLRIDRETRALDMKTLNALLGVANGSHLTEEQLGGKTAAEYFGLDGIRERIKGEVDFDIKPEEWQSLVEKINEKLKELDLPPIVLDVETGTLSKLTKESDILRGKIGYITDAISSVGSALQSIEDPGAKVAGIVAEAIASVVAGFATASAAAANTNMGVFPWIAATAAGVATMASTVAAIKDVTEYHADGGMVGMFQPRGTDVVPAMLTPGEEVLPMSDPRHRNNIGRMQGPAMNGGVVRFELEGRKLIGVIDTELRASGGGRSIISKMR